MLSALAAVADVRGHRVDVSWTWSGLGARPSFRLLRRRRAPSVGVWDGYPVLDVGELFREPAEPWERAARVRFAAHGSSAEGGLIQAEIVFFHDAPGDSDPVRVEIGVFDPAAGMLVWERIDGVTGVALALPDAGPWGRIETLDILHSPGDGAEVPAGTVTVFGDHSDGTTPSLFRWERAGAVAAEVDFDGAELLQTRIETRIFTEREVLIEAPRIVRLDGWDLGTALSAPETADAEVLAEDRRLLLSESFSEETGDWTRRIRVSDLRAATEETSYYTLFRRDPPSSDSWVTERGWTTRATPTARYGFPDRLYELLPSVHQYYDEPTRAHRNEGQLRRFLHVFGVALDHLRSEAESLRTRHDLADVRGDLLPALGGWIGWSTDLTAAMPVQRSEIGMAPDVYATTGTLPNIVALATRATGWKCEAKEFVNNLFLTNAPEAVPVRELWEIVHDGTRFTRPNRLTRTERFDGCPAPVVTAPGGPTWLFWHSNRSGPWEIWVRVFDGDSSTEPAPFEQRAEDERPPSYASLSPAAIVFPRPGGDELWLVWESDRSGSWDIWGRVRTGTEWDSPFAITAHRAADRRPAVALGPSGTLWVFWESQRRGPTEIWSRVYDGTRWMPSVRVTDGADRDLEPAAAMDAGGRLWLVWRRDEADRSRLYCRVLEAGEWGRTTILEDQERSWRDAAPTLVRRGSELWLLWHSDRTGRWELWARVHDGTDWGEPFQVTMTPDSDKEPAAVLDGADLRIFWRSEHPAMEYRSRTLDTSDTELLEQRGLFGDRIHYTYDTAREDVDWYARDVVGLYVTPPRNTPTTVVEEVLGRAGTYLDSFRPATVRLVLIPARAPASADFHTDGIDVDDPIVDEFEDEIE